ncbi:MAG: hypothetical protein LBC09_07095, partial [Helicobacteraceae bacterium]|nr:hypothetical protein [Helicobacteraceae bacterium]
MAGYVSGGSISNSYATGDISGIAGVGGIAGTVGNGSTIQNNAAINPSITGIASVNRIVGFYDSSTIFNNIALTDMAITPAGSNGESGSNASGTDLKKRLTYETDLGWDFTTVWTILENESYP